MPPRKTWKTVIGFLLGVVAIFTAYVQSRGSSSPLGFEPANWLVPGCAHGVGAMTGDAVKSRHSVDCRITLAVANYFPPSPHVVRGMTAESRAAYLIPLARLVPLVPT